MKILRWIFLAACLGCVAIVAVNGRWEARLTYRNVTSIIDQGRSPIWAPPELPSYERFREDFGKSPDFPAVDAPPVPIERKLKLDWMAADLLLYLWFVTVPFGLLYFAVRGRTRDPILGAGLSAGIGLTGGAAACIGTYMLLGGWGPPTPALFGGLGLAIGVALWWCCRDHSV
jgi:hypothetical protein